MTMHDARLRRGLRRRMLRSAGARSFRGRREVLFFKGRGSRIPGRRGLRCRCHRPLTRPTRVGRCGRLRAIAGGLFGNHATTHGMGHRCEAQCRQLGLVRYPLEGRASSAWRAPRLLSRRRPIRTKIIALEEAQRPPLRDVAPRHALFAPRVLLEDSTRAKARRAISAGACSGNGNTELTLISQST
jgi:hypothetical protein